MPPLSTLTARATHAPPLHSAAVASVPYELELELELLQAHMAQRPLLRVEVGARALRMWSVSREGAWASAGMQGAWVSGCGREAD